MRQDIFLERKSSLPFSFAFQSRANIPFDDYVNEEIINESSIPNDFECCSKSGTLYKIKLTTTPDQKLQAETTLNNNFRLSIPISLKGKDLPFKEALSTILNAINLAEFNQN